MKHITRIAALMLAALFALSLIGCNSNAQIQPEQTQAQSEQTPAQPEQTPSEPEQTPSPMEQPDMREFTDSVGRTVELPYEITKVAVSGPLTQIVLFALCPDKLVGVSGAWSKDAEKYIAAEYYNLPELGQLYGGKGELNLETLLDSGAQVVIDVGEPKGSVKEDLDALSEQTGIPFVHITATLESMPEAYLKLGELLNMPEEAEALAAYCEEHYTMITKLMEGASKVKLLYCLGDEGLNVIAKGSYHAEVIDLLSDNAAIVDEPSSKGSGNEVDMEQIMLWDPDVIIFAPDSVYSKVGEDELWNDLKAIKDGKYYEVPFGPYNWLGFPPGVQRYLGMLWLAKLLYPDAASYDMYTEAAEYFKLFYHCDLTEGQYNELVANSIAAVS